MALILATASLLQHFASGCNLQLLRFNREPELLRDLAFELLDLFALKLDDLLAVVADDVIVIWMIGVIWIVKLVVLSEIHFAHQAAFGQKR